MQSLSQLCWHLITSLSVPQNISQIRMQLYLHTPSILKFSFWQSDRQEGNAITKLAPASWPRGVACVHAWGMCACDKSHVSFARLWSRNSRRRTNRRKKMGSLCKLTSNNKHRYELMNPGAKCGLSAGCGVKLMLLKRPRYVTPSLPSEADSGHIGMKKKKKNQFNFSSSVNIAWC